MPSTKPLIALRLEPQLYESVCAAARADGRSPSNFIAHQLRRTFGPGVPLNELLRPKQMRQMDIAEAIAGAVKRGPVKRAAKPK